MGAGKSKEQAAAEAAAETVAQLQRDTERIAKLYESSKVQVVVEWADENVRFDASLPSKAPPDVVARHNKTGEWDAAAITNALHAAVVKAGADTDHDIAIMHAPVGFKRAVHSEHAQPLIVAGRVCAQSHQS